ncbi:MAG: MBG domain-containing protein, partial [Cyanobacteriota bacterium]
INLVGGILTIDPASLTITANDTSKIYGSANPVFTSTFTGLVAGDQPADYTVNYATIANALSDVGNYAVTPGGVVNPNYNISYSNGILTVNPATLTVTAINTSKYYGDVNPILSANCSGFVLGQTLSDFNGSLNVTTNALLTSNAGRYSLVPSGISNPNYQVNYINGLLYINPVDLIISANDTSKIFGTINPTFTANYNGFVLNQNPLNLSGAIGFSTNAAQFSNPGDYNIVPYGYASSNYNIIYNNAVLTVNPLTINNVQVDTVVEMINNDVQQDTAIALNTEAIVNNILNVENVNVFNDYNANIEDSVNDSILVFNTDNKKTSEIITETQNISVAGRASMPTVADPAIESEEISVATGDIVDNASSDNTSPDEGNSSTSNNQITWSTVKQILNKSSDEPIQASNTEFMSVMFNICQGTDDCKKIITPEAVEMTVLSINLQKPELEYQADAKSVDYLMNAGYHNAGLKGYLNIIDLIENVQKENSDDIPEFQNYQAYRDFSYRHPPTLSRISKLTDILYNNHKISGLGILNKPLYNQTIQKKLPLRPKIKSLLDIIHQFNDINVYSSN